ncbi:MAG: DUF1800 family protein [Hyphomicrobiales bacterium]|nr:DUF1800 family protein [Hyphomicrobiales bacterium]
MGGDPRLTLQAVHRFGLGLRPGDLQKIGADVRDLFRAEVDRKVMAPLSGLPFASINEAAPALREFAERERMAREARGATRTAAITANSMGGTMGGGMAQTAPTSTPPQQPPPAVPPGTGQAAARPQAAEPPLPQRVYREEARARFHAMLEPLGGYTERLVAFWGNHFAVSVNKGNPVRTFAGLLEREAIRPHVYGRFADMLLAVETHPAMIVFLDNHQSLGPNSRAGNRRGRGLNENLAREILELHTLGVAGGYSQADVTALARLITGWTLVAPNAADGIPGTFRFNPNMHEPGSHQVLGKTYADAGNGFTVAGPANAEPGFERGRAALTDIARHPATAQHIARKLTRHFVADDPPASMVARLAKVFRDSDGNLQAVSRAVLDSPEAWSAPSAKMRTPQEFLLAAARALGRKPDVGQILQPLNAMGQPMWQPGGPNGFPDTVAAWASPEGLKTRLDVAAAIARQTAAGIDPQDLISNVFGAAASNETRQAVLRAESRYQAVAIALMSPEFQRR